MKTIKYGILGKDIQAQQHYATEFKLENYRDVQKWWWRGGWGRDSRFSRERSNVKERRRLSVTVVRYVLSCRTLFMYTLKTLIYGLIIIIFFSKIISL